jgi:hypothetical protein
VGDDAYARTVHDAFGIQIFRFINDRDIVPRVPFFGMGFRHYGCEIFFDHQQKQVDGKPCVENLAGALMLARLALAAGDAVQDMAKLTAQAAIQAGFHGNPLDALHRIVKALEDGALGVSKALLAAGTENIADHDMRKNYLVRLGTSL